MSSDHLHERGATTGRAFAIGIALNLGFVVVEVVYGVLSGSVALLADASHNFGDVLGLALSWSALIVARRAPTKRKTYGLRSATILASLTNGVVLLFVTGGIAWEAAQRLLLPEPLEGKTVVVVALLGVVVNAASALLFAKGKQKDLNVRSAFLHLASDAALALGVAISGLVFMFTRWSWLDPVVSILLSLVILVSTFSLIRRALHLALQGVPSDIDTEHVERLLLALPNVSGVHDLHIWSMSTTQVALTVHLVTPTPTPALLDEAVKQLRERFDIEHSTIQIESAGGATCMQSVASSGTLCVSDSAVAT